MYIFSLLQHGTWQWTENGYLDNTNDNKQAAKFSSCTRFPQLHSDLSRLSATERANLVSVKIFYEFQICMIKIINILTKSNQGSCTKAPEQENERGEREQKGKCKIFNSEIRSLVKRKLRIEMKIMVATLRKLSASIILFVPANWN